MTAEEMLAKVQQLKEQSLFNGFERSKEIDDFFNEYWLQVLDILDDALYEYLNNIGRIIK